MPWEPEPEWHLGRAVSSPDGALRVEEWEEPQERAPDSRSLRIFDAATGELVVTIGGASWTASPAFPAPGEVVLQIEYCGVPMVLRVNARAGSFSFPPGREEPLEAIYRRLAEALPRHRASRDREVSLRELLFETVMLLGGLALTTAAVVVLLFLAKNPRERWTAIGGTLFFGACTVWSFHDLQRMRLRRNGRASTPSREDPDAR